MRRPALASALLLLSSAVAASPRAEAQDAPPPPVQPPAAPVPPPGPPPGLRPGEVLFRPETGRAYWFVLRTKLDSLLKAGKKRFPAAGASVNDVALTPGARGEDGTFPVSVRVARATGWWEDPDHPRTEFDTLAAPIPREHPAWYLFETVAPASFRVHADGRIAEVAGMVADMARVAPLARNDRARHEYSTGWRSGLGLYGFAGTWPVLPPRRTGAGSFFETESIPPVPRGQFQVLRLRHEVKRIDDRSAVFDTKGGVDDIDPANQAGKSKRKDEAPAGPRVKVSGFGQSSEVDRVDGVVLRSSARFTIVTEQRFSVDGDSVEGTSTYTWEATLERRDAPPDLPAAPSAPPPAPAKPPAEPGPAPAPPPPR